MNKGEQRISAGGGLKSPKKKLKSYNLTQTKILADQDGF